MEGSASSASVEDGAENKRHADEGTPEENAGPSTEETADSKHPSTGRDLNIYVNTAPVRSCALSSCTPSIGKCKYLTWRQI